MTELTIRDAAPSDRPTFAKLVHGLGVDDPVPTLERFAGEMIRTMRSARSRVPATTPSTLMIENDRALAESLVGAGATLKLEAAFMREPL